MSSKTWTHIIALTLFAALAIPVSLAAQDQAKPKHHGKHHHYQINDVGTLGGPSSYMLEILGSSPGAVNLNNRGTLVESADTLTLDPYCSNYPDCHAAHAFQWQDGETTDLGVLAGGVGSQVDWISANGLMAGISDNGQPDPLSGGTLPQVHGVLWEHGGVTDLKTLPEGGYQSWPTAVNRRGEVVGEATNTIPDSNSMWTQFGYSYQVRAFLWDKQMGMQDLGTLSGGTNATAALITERGQVVGASYTSSNPNLDNLCNGYPLTTGSFIWDKKNGMKDLGNLGGASCTLPYGLNNRGQVVGGSDVPGEFQHPFVWDAATGMTDLGTPDGGYGVAQGINEHGEVVGFGSNGVFHALVWRKRGGKWRTTDLGTMGSNCSAALSINESGQVVGTSGDSCRPVVAFLWEHGGSPADLNTLVSPNSGLQLFEALRINNRGEIAVNGKDADGNNHAVLLIPCDENHSGVEGCDYSLVDAPTSTASVSPVPAIQRPEALTPRDRVPGGLFNRHRFPWQRAPGSGSGPASNQKQALPANKVTHDWIADHVLDPQYRGNSGYCEEQNGVLNGYCAAFVSSWGYCSAQPSTDCTRGQKATKPGNFDCFGFHEYSADLGRKCSFATLMRDFTLSSSTPTPATVSPGGSSTAAVDVTAINGFNGSVALTCTVTPSPALAPACSISPSSVPPGTPATLTVSTTGPSANIFRSNGGSGLSYAVWLPLIGLFAMGAGRNRKGKTTAVALACIFAGLVFQAACGGSNSIGVGNPGTPAGTYTITVNGADASGSLKHSTAAMLRVQ
jgi:probable HAF family extracellular repeat protein